MEAASQQDELLTEYRGKIQTALAAASPDDELSIELPLKLVSYTGLFTACGSLRYLDNLSFESVEKMISSCGDGAGAVVLAQATAGFSATPVYLVDAPSGSPI